MDSTGERPARRVPKLRLAAFILIFGFINAGPIYRQVLGGKSEILRPWVMFSRVFDVCRLDYRIRAEDGTETPVDRLAVLGYEGWWKAPRSTRRVGEKALDASSRRLCQKLDPGTDLRLYADCPTRTASGWKTVSQGEENVCAARSSRPPGSALPKAADAPTNAIGGPLD